MEVDLDYFKMYIVNLRATTKKVLKKRSINDIPRDEIKWNHIKCSIKPREGGKERNKEQRETKNKFIQEKQLQIAKKHSSLVMREGQIKTHSEILIHNH